MSLKSYQEWRGQYRSNFLDEVEEIIAEHKKDDWHENPQPEVDEIPMYSLTEDGWCEIKGIGVKLAKRLVENGPYKSLDEIAKVKGIKQNVLECIRDFLFSSPTPEKSNDPPQTV
jgi:hypothetical protein